MIALMRGDQPLPSQRGRAGLACEVARFPCNLTTRCFDNSREVLDRGLFVRGCARRDNFATLNQRATARVA
jgi:hypothetical protein